MNATTIKINKVTKNRLDKFREYKNESYDEVINKVIFVAENVKSHPDLSKETVFAIENARDRIKKGNFIIEAEAKKRLGL